MLLDLNMPEMNGLEVLARRQAERLHPHVPIVLVTTESTEDDEARGRAAGAWDYLRKPFQPSDIQRLVAARPRAEAEPGSGMKAEENPFGELLQDYIVECLPLAEQVGDAFVELERRWRDGEPGDELLASVKGRLHTIKGNSAMMGLTPDAGRRPRAGGRLRVPRARAGEPGGGGRGAARRGRRPPGGSHRQRVAGGRWRPGGRLRRAGAELPRRSPRERPRPRATGARRSGGAGPASEDGGAASNVVRVDFRRLDAMLEVLGEGLIQHSALVEVYRRLLRRVGRLRGARRARPGRARRSRRRSSGSNPP